MTPRSNRKKQPIPYEFKDQAPPEACCFGYCVACEKFHSLPTEKAIPHCFEMMEQLRIHQRIDYDKPLELADERLRTDFIYAHMGQMFGVLVCQNQEGQEVILKAFSCKHNNIWNVEGWVPPLIDENKYAELVEWGNRIIYPLTDALKTIPRETPKWHETRSQRKKNSHTVLAEFLKLYKLRNFKNEHRDLTDVFIYNNLPPMGTGDCCAPKLLNFAIENNLTPLSMAEFYWGKETSNGERKEGEFYGSCEHRCIPILGFMLCGAN